MDGRVLQRPCSEAEEDGTRSTHSGAHRSDSGTTAHDVPGPWMHRPMSKTNAVHKEESTGSIAKMFRDPATHWRMSEKLVGLPEEDEDLPSFDEHAPQRVPDTKDDRLFPAISDKEGQLEASDVARFYSNLEFRDTASLELRPSDPGPLTHRDPSSGMPARQVVAQRGRSGSTNSKQGSDGERRRFRAIATTSLLVKLYNDYVLRLPGVFRSNDPDIPSAPVQRVPGTTHKSFEIFSWPVLAASIGVTWNEGEFESELPPPRCWRLRMLGIRGAPMLGFVVGAGALLALTLSFAVRANATQLDIEASCLLVVLLFVLVGVSGILGLCVGLMLSSAILTRPVMAVLFLAATFYLQFALMSRDVLSFYCYGKYDLIASPSMTFRVLAKAISLGLTSSSARHLQTALGVPMRARCLRGMVLGMFFFALVVGVVCVWSLPRGKGSLISLSMIAGSMFGFVALAMTFFGVCVFILRRLKNLARGARLGPDGFAHQDTARRAHQTVSTIFREVVWIFAMSVLIVICEVAARVTYYYDLSETLKVYSVAVVVLSVVDAVVCQINAMRMSGVFALRKRMNELEMRHSAWRKRGRINAISAIEVNRSVSDVAWWKRVEELSNRGITLRDLMQFYRGLGHKYMEWFDPKMHTTRDVTRAAIIPLSAASKSSFAEFLVEGRPVRPTCLVTHAWSNLFVDLVAAIVAQALDLNEFSTVADLLTWDAAGLENTLDQEGKLDDTYWICIFAISQHDNICGANLDGDRDPVTREEYPPCRCGKTKYFNRDGTLDGFGRSIECELNKFGDVLAFLATEMHCFRQVIAVDQKFNLFKMAWCIAEIAQAWHMGVEQSMMVSSEGALNRHKAGLRLLRVEEMTASRAEDVKEILSNIQDTTTFNTQLQQMIFGATGLLAEWWHAMTRKQKMTSVGIWLRWVVLKKVRTHVSCREKPEHGLRVRSIPGAASIAVSEPPGGRKPSTKLPL